MEGQLDLTAGDRRGERDLHLGRDVAAGRFELFAATGPVAYDAGTLPQPAASLAEPFAEELADVMSSA